MKNRPSKDTLESLIQNYPFVKIGKIYGVSDKAIVKWCKGCGLPFRKSDIKQKYRRVTK